MLRVILFIKSIIPKINHFCRLQDNIIHALKLLVFTLWSVNKRGKMMYKSNKRKTKL